MNTKSYFIGFRVVVLPLITVLLLCSTTNYPVVPGFYEGGISYRIYLKGDMLWIGRKPGFVDPGTGFTWSDDGYFTVEEDSLYVGLYYRSGKQSHYTVPSTVEHDGKTYRVIYIGGKYDSQSAHVFNYFSDNEDVESITMEEGVLGSGPNGFQNCKKLREINFPKSFQSIAYGCFALSNCLDSLDFPCPILHAGHHSFATSSVKYIRVNDLRYHEAFEEKDSLAIYKIFSTCTNLQDIVIADSPYFQSHDGMIFNRQDSTLLYWVPQKEEIVLPDTIKGVDAGAVATLQSNVKRLVLPRDLGPYAESGLPKILVTWKNLDELDFSRCKNYRQIDGVVYDMTGSSLVYCPPSVTEIRMADFAKRFYIDMSADAWNKQNNVETIVLSPSLAGWKDSNLYQVLSRWKNIKTIAPPQGSEWLEVKDNCIYDKTDSLTKWVPATITEFCPPDFVLGFDKEQVFWGHIYNRFYNVERFRIPTNWARCSIQGYEYREWETTYPGSVTPTFFHNLYNVKIVECAPDCKNYVVIDNKVFSKDTVIHHLSYTATGDYVIPKQVRMITARTGEYLNNKIDCMTIYAEEPPFLPNTIGTSRAIPVFVPDNSVEKYEAATGWKHMLSRPYVTGYFPMSQKEQVLVRIQQVESGVNDASVMKRYNASGVELAAPKKGLNILRMSDGSVRKVMVK